MHLDALQDTIFGSCYQFLLAEANSNLKFVLECLDCTHILFHKKHKFELSQSVSQSLYILSLKFFLDFIFMSFEFFGQEGRGKGTDLYTHKSLISTNLKLSCLGKKL